MYVRRALRAADPADSHVQARKLLPATSVGELTGAHRRRRSAGNGAHLLPVVYLTLLCLDGRADDPDPGRPGP
jgi:hypothetical protein